MTIIPSKEGTQTRCLGDKALSQGHTTEPRHSLSLCPRGTLALVLAPNESNRLEGIL